MTSAFSHRRLEWLLRARGTDVVAWPDADRIAALELMRRSNQAQLAYAEALAREGEFVGSESDDDCAVFRRMQSALRRRLAPLPVALRGLTVGVLVVCVVAGLYLATATAVEPEGTPDFFTAQTVSLASLDQ